MLVDLGFRIYELKKADLALCLRSVYGVTLTAPTSPNEKSPKKAPIEAVNNLRSKAFSLNRRQEDL